jgi:alanyl-tRNA synthetase
MHASELRQLYHQFFEERGHRRIPSAPLMPENDSTVLFTTAGMHPLVPFLLGEPHPQGKRLVNVQRCIRTGDIEEVGDASHLTFFEMLGNWSLGDYFKEESLAWSYEFLTQVLDLNPASLSVTVFAGDESAPRDEESAQIWRRLGIPNERIHYLPKSDNWWGPAGNTGPCGPDSEMFYDTGRASHPGCRPGCGCGKWLEIWNNVFMEYNKTADGRYVRLSQRNVDTGMGVERTVAALNNFQDVYQVETIFPLIEKLEEISRHKYQDEPRPFRVIADHLRAASLAIADGASPSNIDAGYVVRRLIRRAVRYGRDLGIQENFCARLGHIVLDLFNEVYAGLEVERERVVSELDAEESKFKRTLERGLREVHKEIERAKNRGERVITSERAFYLFETFGFPLPFTVELAREQGFEVDEEGTDALFEQHRQLSRRSQEGRFKGGLADNTRETTALHTATHLLHQALRQVLGSTVRQSGSNITAQRLRFDFSYPEKLTPQQIAEIETIVNHQIKRDLPVSVQVQPLEEAMAQGALAFFGEKYGSEVKVYSVGDFSKEVCGGPHVNRTGELGAFEIVRQEAVGQGLRRIKAVLKKE